MECRNYEHVKDTLQVANSKLTSSWQYAIGMAIMTGLSKFTERIASDSAQWVLTGFKGGGPVFYRKGWSGFLDDVGKETINVMITSMARGDFMQNELRINICAPITLNLKLMLGLNVKKNVYPNNCGMDVLARNFEQTYRSLSPTDLSSALNNTIKKDNDIKLQFYSNQQFLNTAMKNDRNQTLSRQEGGGLKTLTDLISNRITTPMEVMKTNMQVTNASGRNILAIQNNSTLMATQAFTAGLAELPKFAAGAFVSTLAVGLLDKFFNLFAPKPGDDNVDLLNIDVQPNTDQGAIAARKAMVVSDIVIPNLFSNDKQDLLFELNSCPEPRGTWGCSLDDGLAQALRSATENGAYTVSRAAGIGNDSQGSGGQVFLHPDWELVPETDAKDNQDPGCYLRAYCSSNLAKLRFARIIPVGWELAANSPSNKQTNGKFVTLGEVIAGFNVCGGTADAPVLDAQHPWCHLINPAWILTAPNFQCNLRGYGDTLASADQSLRTQECQDVVSCLKRNDKGECVGGYGYCLSDRTVWRFGADACEEKYASCRTYTARDEGASAGKQVSYVRNTIDYGQCNQDNVGCMMYATTHDVSMTAPDQWVRNWTRTTDKKGINLQMPRVYFDSTVEPCDASGDGCTKMLKATVGQPALNLVQNGSFEQVGTDGTSYVGWSQTGAPQAGDSAVDGARSVALTSSVFMYQIVGIQPSRNYVLSFYAKHTATNGGSVSVYVQPLRADGQGADTTKTYYKSATCTAGTGKGVAIEDPPSEWTRYTCEFVSNQDAAQAVVNISGDRVSVDAVELEEGTTAASFVDGEVTTLSVNYLKVPPDEFGCTGNSATDRKECANFARICKQTDVGCQGYTESGGTGTEIPATLNPTDYCPNSCVGYAEYRKMSSAFDLTTSANQYLNDAQDDTLADFVPKNAGVCSADAAGCETFTNMESSAAGGESKAYFSYARACEKPNDNSRTYFTWEGSDVTGYQLRTWSLIKEDPQVASDDLGAGTEQPGGPKILHKAGPDGILKDPANCNEQSWKTGVDVDCRQVYDEAGQVFYRYFSQTVLSTTACVDYRKSNSDADDCSKTGGDYQGATKDCIYKIAQSESLTCQLKDAGCRAYRGTTGRNTSTVFTETFAGTTNSTFSANAQTNGNTILEVSNEALLVGDHSLKMSVRLTNTVPIETSFNFPSTTSSLYVLSFWAKTTAVKSANSAPAATIKVDGTTVNTVPLEVDWKRFEVGPFVAGSIPSSKVVFSITPNTTYIDEVRVDRLQDIVYVKKDSWIVPAECDQTSQGVPLLHAMLGCREYHDRNNNVVDIFQFSHLCRFDSIGCSAFVNTKNSDSPYVQNFPITGIPDPIGDTNTKPTPGKSWDWLYAGTVTVTRPADRMDYLIDEPSAHCDQAQMSCRAFGKPLFNQDGTVSSTETVYLKDDITKYTDERGEPNMLCRPSELFCDKFVSGPVTSFFRDPFAMGDHTCEWKQRVLLNEQTNYGVTIPKGEYGGWFIHGTETPCYPDKVSTGNTFITEFAGAPNYRGWTEICPAEASECTEFRDPNDHTDQAHPSGRSYYFIANDRLDVTSCAGKVDLFGGCVLFQDTSDSGLTMSTVATYKDSHAHNDNPVSAVNCDTDPGNAYCAGAANDTNRIVKVKLDRDCQTWLGCSSAETVYDPAQAKYVDLCTDLKVCDQPGGSASKNFCAHYVDRTVGGASSGTGFHEPVLLQGRFFDTNTYVDRPTGFGDPDYSGYAIPNHFQVADMVTRRVAYDLLAGSPGAKRDSFIRDYRLVARVPMASGNGGATKYSDQKYPLLKLCKDNKTGQVGYYTAEDDTTCYLAIDTPYSQNAADATGQGNVNPRNAQNAANSFQQLADSSVYQPLNEGYPRPECKAYPEMNSPFPNSYVKTWDIIADPQKPKTYVDGYQGVSTCEFGEDCACSYRKVSYSGAMKYMAMYGTSAPEGICIGGSHDGWACIPGQDTTSSNVPTIVNAASSTPAASECPGGGSCTAMDSVTFVRGVFGQCLARDRSRTVGGSQGYNPCLIWNPTPILFGSSDVYHYQPTAGYLPVSNAGEYYCVAGARPPVNVQVPAGPGGSTRTDGAVKVNVADWVNAFGLQDMATFYFDNSLVSDGKCAGCAGNNYDENTHFFIDGLPAEGGFMGGTCEEADDHEESYPDYMAGRWIQTGRGLNHNYAEYFIPINTQTWGGWLDSVSKGGKIKTPPDCKANESSIACEALSEHNFSFFNFSPIKDQGKGMIGCGYSAHWVPGLDVNYDDSDSLKANSDAWMGNFMAGLKGTIGPESADYLKNEDGTQLQQIPCNYASSHQGSGGAPKNNPCYYKFWEGGYNNDGQSAFRMEWGSSGGPRGLDKNPVLFRTSDATKPFFAIRAMFEDTNTQDNDQDPADLDPSGNSLTGPFRFIGWWVTATVPGVTDEMAIYMYLTIGHSDICKEVAQVVAPDTRDATPFMDRYPEASGFLLPVLAYNYGTTNAPWGSAKNNRPIGTSPLYQTHGKMPGTDSKLKPPAFTASGVEYVNTGSRSPIGNWAWLTNIFARVYRVYRWYDQPVTKASWACVTGPRAGSWCPDLSKNPNADKVAREYCGYQGTCDPKQVNVAQGQALCNALSGVNAGLPCSGDTGDPISGYHVCHAAPMKSVNGMLTPQYTSCDLQPNWTNTGSTFKILKTKTASLAGAGCTPGTETAGVNDSAWWICNTSQQVAIAGALKCAKGSVTYPDGTQPDCSKATKGPSTECPIQVIGGTDSKCINKKSGTSQGYCSNGYGHSSCTNDDQCEFTWKEWWGNTAIANPQRLPPFNQDFPIGYPEAHDAGNSSRPYNNLAYSDNDKGFSSGILGNIWWNNNGGGSSDGLTSTDNPPNTPNVDIGKMNMWMGRYLVFGSKPAELDRFPGAYVAAFTYSGTDYTGDIFIPGHCERPPIMVESGTQDDRPYHGNNVILNANSAAVDRYRGQTWAPGLCVGGSYENASCNSEKDCTPPGVTQAQLEASKNYCQPVSKDDGVTPNADSCVTSADPQNCFEGVYIPQWTCNDPTGDPKSTNLDTDNNKCTHNAGYYPRADLCGNDPTRPECLTGITQNDMASIGTVGTGGLSLVLPPTDVTNGLYTLDYLAQKNGALDRFSSVDQRYITYYTPRPPTIAAPDTSRACPAAGQCQISKVGGFALENQSEGTVAYIGGQAIGTIRFYAWAADNQGPIKDVWVDWGDGTRQEFHDAKMKNKKPFCGVSKQCSLVPGLTCQSDNDCPPTAGKCVDTGFCKARPTVACVKDDDCLNGVIKDKCVTRETFGNTPEACEQNYFEFTHAYACSQNTKPPLCGNSNRCSNDPSNTSTCAPGDKSLPGLAPPGGCWDDTNAACRFTPRVLVKDNWGWCTGECRVQNLGNGILGSGFQGVNNMLFANGGCYDATGVYTTKDSSVKMRVGLGADANDDKWKNACDPDKWPDRSSTSYRPWIVFPGALQLGVTP